LLAFVSCKKDKDFSGVMVTLKNEQITPYENEISYYAEYTYPAKLLDVRMTYSESPTMDIVDGVTCDVGYMTIKATVTGLKSSTKYYYKLCYNTWQGTLYSSVKSFVTGGHGCVDLGLPSGLLWATCNVGASYSGDYGNYYAWGETTPNSYYSWSSYKWCNGSFSTITKYNTISSYGTVDNKTVLESGDDAAHVNWDDDWRMPTTEEWQELYDNTTSTWIKQNGVYGRLFTSTVAGYSGVSLFLPASGSITGASLYGNDINGSYWSGSLNTSIPDCAYYVFFDSDDVKPHCHTFRDVGFSVRPVCSSKK